MNRIIDIASGLFDVAKSSLPLLDTEPISINF
jgi:hypothetical protein